MPCFGPGPPLEQLREEPIDHPAEEDVSSPFRVEIPHLSGHLDKQYILGSLTAKNGNSMWRKVPRENLFTPDEDILDSCLDTSHEGNLLAFEDHFIRQLRHDQPPHVRTDHELVPERDIHMGRSALRTVDNGDENLGSVFKPESIGNAAGYRNLQLRVPRFDFLWERLGHKEATALQGSLELGCHIRMKRGAGVDMTVTQRSRAQVRMRRFSG